MYLRLVETQIIIDEMNGTPVAEHIAWRQCDVGRPVHHVVHRNDIGNRIVDKNGGRITVGELVQGLK